MTKLVNLLTNVAVWLENGCDPAMAAKELRMICSSLPDEPKSDALACTTCKRPFEQVSTAGASADPLACLHPVVMGDVTNNRKWCYTCGKTL